MLQRSHIVRPLILFVTTAAWIFLFCAVGSFHPTDWPSHAVYPYPPIQNICGPVGAFIAYWCFLAIGQGVFPLIFFSGVCLALTFYHAKLSDPWLRIIGLAILSTAFAALVHHFMPGSASGFPEGHGGVIGISTAAFLQTHFHTVGTRLILLAAILIGLLLAADDLVLKPPGFAAHACNTVADSAPKVKFSFAFPALPNIFKRKTVAPVKPLGRPHLEASRPSRMMMMTI